MPNDEVSLIAFAHSSFMLAPFSSDKATLKQIIEGVNDNYINMSSTDFTGLANFTVELLDKKKPKILIVFTDGGDDKAIAEFSEIIEDNKVSLYMVLIGTHQGSPVIGSEGKPLKQNGKIAITQRNDELGAVAMNNNGAYIVANTGTTGIKDLVTTIKSHHKNSEQGEIIIHDREELFYYPLGFGLFLLLIGFGSLPRRD
jgi:Ca-activated chloride channel family protein